MSMPGPVSGPIPAPADFPVAWEEPDHAELLWFWDQMHHPQPTTPITFAIDGPAFTAGIGKAAEALFMPIKTFRAGCFNNYWYFANEPCALSAAETAEREQRMEAEMVQRAPRVLQDWENVYLPEVMTLNDWLRHYPYQDASPNDLAGFLDEACAIRDRQWELHFLAVMPVFGAAGQFAEFYEEHLGRPENNEHYQMLQGFANKSVEAGQALYDLAQEARAVPSVAQTIRETPAGRLLAELARSTAGREYLDKLEVYLEGYGWRSEAFEFMDPSWREDPRPALHALKGYIRDDATDPRLEQAKAVRERQRLVQETRERLPADQAVRNQFEMLLFAAQQYLPVQENHNFYIDQMNTVLLRLPILELGRRLAASGALADVTDAFFLTPGEMQQATVSANGRWRALTAQRRADRETWRKVLPPVFLGTMPEGEAPRQEIQDRFFGLRMEPSRDPRVVNGFGASKGVVTAPAKVVCTLNESDKLQRGDVLVCEMTMPAWTPLFSLVSAVVADSGGVLSHCAIVAREYGIPCVTGTRLGTKRIRDGQTVTVDGAKGIVRIEG
ncbi:MAG TPA: PEP-utilizing enzyme [Dehalococcoidia bacterium]|nr:PEP-utilizing enzyme [Dehalococcoidia bacterium]